MERRELRVPRLLTLMVFASIALVYLALSPLSIAGMGYSEENLTANERIADAISGKRVVMAWPRHGIIEPAIQAPSFFIGRLVFGPDGVWKDRLSSLYPLFETALLCTILFVWSAELAGNLLWGWIVAMVAAFCTMLWPYAYIGMETTQSLAMLFAAYVALQRPPGPLRQAVWLGVAGGIAVGVKSNGLFLGPAVAFLIWEYIRRTEARKRAAAGSLMIATAGAILIATAASRRMSDVWSVGALTIFRAASVDFPTFVINILSLLFSVNKGLLVFAPVCILAALSIKAAFRERPDIVAFALLACCGMAAGVAILYYWSDETWGPRYLHSTIGPLLLCFAASRRPASFRVLREIPFLAAAAAGVVVSFLGVLFYYGNVHSLAQRTSHPVLEELQHDTTWNHPRIHLALARILVASAPRAEPWPPPIVVWTLEAKKNARHWWFAPPIDPPALKQVDLRSYATPQPLLLFPSSAETPKRRAVQWGLFVSLCLGCVLAVWSCIVARRRSSSALTHLQAVGSGADPPSRE